LGISKHFQASSDRGLSILKAAKYASEAYRVLYDACSEGRGVQIGGIEGKDGEEAVLSLLVMSRAEVSALWSDDEPNKALPVGERREGDIARRREEREIGH
jgi:hypothetical protein